MIVIPEVMVYRQSLVVQAVAAECLLVNVQQMTLLSALFVTVAELQEHITSQ